jgi:hypothetical protein
MNLDSALDIIGYSIGVDVEDSLRVGLPGGREEDLGYDPQLVIELALACQRWHQRLDDLEKLWMVNYYQCCDNPNDGGEWITIATGLRKEEAYRIWYEKTNGGKEEHHSLCDSYYHFGLEEEELTGRHAAPQPYEDDFSYQYLLTKSFGE